MTISGTIIDSSTRRGIPSVSITLVDQLGRPTGIGKTSDGSGNFSISGEQVRYPNELLFSSVGYQLTGIQLDDSGAMSVVIQMNRDVKELDPVIVSSSKGSAGAGLGLAALLLLAATKKKKAVGEIKTDHVILGFVVIGGLMFFDAISKIFTGLGLGGPGGAHASDEVTNPKSPWKPVYLDFIPGGTEYKLLTVSAATNFSEIIKNAFTVAQDHYNEIVGVFSQLKTKSQVASLSKRFFELYNLDLLSFLRDGGGVLPWDGLSDDHLRELTALVDNLPQYKPR